MLISGEETFLAAGMASAKALQQEQAWHVQEQEGV